eukprot:410234-Alexandrium_andersonii.AAC.1
MPGAARGKAPYVATLLPLSDPGKRSQPGTTVGGGSSSDAWGSPASEPTASAGGRRREEGGGEEGTRRGRDPLPPPETATPGEAAHGRGQQTEGARRGIPQARELRRGSGGDGV